MLITLTKIPAFCTLRTFVLTMGLTQNVPSQHICFYTNGDNSAPRWSPDMILTAFDVKFHEIKKELPPEA